MFLASLDFETNIGRVEMDLSVNITLRSVSIESGSNKTLSTIIAGMIEFIIVKFND